MAIALPLAQTHLYKFVLLPENKLTIQIDDDEPATYSLLTDFEPPVNPPAEIDDPTDTKPGDWVDAKMVPDPEATKPEDWDEDAPYMIADPKVRAPARVLCAHAHAMALESLRAHRVTRAPSAPAPAHLSLSLSLSGAGVQAGGLARRCA